MVATEYYVALSAVLFGLGAVGFITRRSAILMFLSVELMLNAANLAMIAYARQWTTAGGSQALQGQGATMVTGRRDVDAEAPCGAGDGPGYADAVGRERRER